MRKLLLAGAAFLALGALTPLYAQSIPSPISQGFSGTCSGGVQDSTTTFPTIPAGSHLFGAKALFTVAPHDASGNPNASNMQVGVAGQGWVASAGLGATETSASWGGAFQGFHFTGITYPANGFPVGTGSTGVVEVICPPGESYEGYAFYYYGQ